MQQHCAVEELIVLYRMVKWSAVVDLMFVQLGSTWVYSHHTIPPTTPSHPSHPLSLSLWDHWPDALYDYLLTQNMEQQQGFRTIFYIPVKPHTASVKRCSVNLCKRNVNANTICSHLIGRFRTINHTLKKVTLILLLSVFCRLYII